MQFSFGENFKSIVNSFVRNEKGEGTKSTNGPKKTSAMSNAGPAAAANANVMDAFQLASETMDVGLLGQTQMNESINFAAETMAACDWAADQSLAEAVDHFENPQVGNSLMLMSLIPGFNSRKK